jgi:hypothetical protein
MTEPRRTPLPSAAGSPIGLNAVSKVTKIRDILIVVVAPFFVPGVLLLVTRSNSSHLFGAFTLGDIAFGFVAVAIAGIARAVTLKSDEWMAFSIGAIVVVALQASVAAKVDTANNSDALRNMVEKSNFNAIWIQLPRMQDLAAAIADAQPTLLQWAATVLSGSALIIVSIELIRRER